jgi:hypothetical protein
MIRIEVYVCVQRDIDVENDGSSIKVSASFIYMLSTWKSTVFAVDLEF